MVNAGNVFSKLLDYKDFNMSITLDEEVKKLTNEYMIRYLELMIEQKKIRESIKDLKSEYDEQGLETSSVLKALRYLQNERKIAPKKDELIAYKNVIENDVNVVDKIAELEAKRD